MKSMYDIQMERLHTKIDENNLLIGRQSTLIDQLRAELEDVKKERDEWKFKADGKELVDLLADVKGWKAELEDVKKERNEIWKEREIFRGQVLSLRKKLQRYKNKYGEIKEG